VILCQKLIILHEDINFSGLNLELAVLPSQKDQSSL
jgi:hypothetical protein